MGLDLVRPGMTNTPGTSQLCCSVGKCRGNTKKPQVSDKRYKEDRGALGTI
jgi:hypothetical protein